MQLAELLRTRVLRRLCGRKCPVQAPALALPQIYPCPILTQLISYPDPALPQSKACPALALSNPLPHLCFSLV